MICIRGLNLRGGEDKVNTSEAIELYSSFNLPGSEKMCRSHKKENEKHTKILKKGGTKIFWQGPRIQ